MRFFFIKNQKEYSKIEVLELKDSPKYMTSNIIYGVFFKMYFDTRALVTRKDRKL